VKKTLISHFYNEEYLLPWWLKHHKKYFDYGIMIDYHSTDNSKKIIEEICPHWTIVTSNNKDFDAPKVDWEVMEIESLISGYKIVLNTTEFLISTKEDWEKDFLFEKYDQILIPSSVMVDDDLNQNELDYNIPLHKQKNKGMDIHIKPKFYSLRNSRSMHKVKVNYSAGRHFYSYNTQEDLIKTFDDGTTSTIFNILWFGFSPYNEKLLKRRLQIQNVAPRSPSFGGHHFTDKEGLDIQYANLLPNSSEINFLKKQNILSY
jgi:hypothetical protein